MSDSSLYPPSKEEKIPSWLKPFFWDVYLEDLDLQTHQVFIIERLLNEGDHRTLAWLFQTYPEESIKAAVKASKALSVKTAGCWQNYFGLRKEEMRCTGIFSTTLGKLY